jgi:hypothetical protein
MINKVKYNSQRDNIQYFKNTITGIIKRFNAWWQCFSTCAWMFMSNYSSKIYAFGDKMLSKYLDDVESTIGEKGIAEKTKKRFNWITGRTSLWWLIQKYGIEKWLWREGIKGNAIFRDKDISFNELSKLLDKGPVILQTKKIGGLKGGHIILAIGYTDKQIICHDPFGNALTKYRDHNGDSVHYPKEWLKKYTGSMIRCIYWREIK